MQILTPGDDRAIALVQAIRRGELVVDETPEEDTG